ncbi:MAG: N-acetyl-gamma-glutamyl-phosphate reductase [Bacteroidia bacterium]|nr:N-acetyl-gamma-glutamyl-phosphate reductase [Bacteroidia bacterium]
MVKTAIIGVSGYAGGELARLLARHPETELTFLSSESNAGKPLAAAFPGLSGTRAGSLVCEHGDLSRASAIADLIFLAQENGAAMKSAPVLLADGKKVIDISADFRLRSPDAYSTWYKMPHTAPRLLESAVYGLPETNRDAIRRASLIANPGCHVTAATLALAPLLAHRMIETRGIIIDSKTGVSGAGRTKTDLIYRFSEANESMKTYGVGGTHRHIPEIEQTLGQVAGEPVTVTFTPHLAPMTRGILATCYARLADGFTDATVRAALTDYFAGHPFVIVREAGDSPSTKDVAGSNFCHLASAVDRRTGMVIVTSVIDNLVKGAAGQAVQNMNLMLGLPETAGLEGGGWWP